MLYNHALGIILLTAHLIGALLNGLLYRNYQCNTNNCINIQNSKNIDSTLSSTLYDSIISILVVGGYIVIANILIDMLGSTGILNAFASFINFISNCFGCNVDIGTGLCNGLLEITRGCKDLASISAPLQIIAPLICGLISWGGISIQLQALTFLQKCNISAGFYMFQKFTQAIISTFICYILCIIFV